MWRGNETACPACGFGVDARVSGRLIPVACILVLLAIGYWLSRESTADRCSRVGVEQVISGLGTGPTPRPSDAGWYAEHCWQGKPR